VSGIRGKSDNNKLGFPTTTSLGLSSFRGRQVESEENPTTTGRNKKPALALTAVHHTTINLLGIQGKSDNNGQE